MPLKKRNNLMTILLNRLFQPRQIVILDKRKAASYSLSRFLQIAIVLVSVLGISWIVHSTAVYLQLHKNLQEQKEEKNQFNRLIAERGEFKEKRLQLEKRVKDLEQKLSDFNEIQTGLVGKLSEWTNDNAEELEMILSHTGLDVNAMLAELERMPNEDSKALGAGGPFIAYISQNQIDSSHFDLTDTSDTHWANLGDHIERWEGIKYLLGHLPLSSPLDHFQVSSKFGKRRDPINGKPSKHYGVDLASYPKSPVLATAPGTVTFSGWKGRYGRLVEIDHGLGIRTRYGHLHKILVKRGDKVEFREKIGLVGSSGRSTGTHTHYAIIVRDVPADPLKFIKAGKYVFKG